MSYGFVKVATAIPRVVIADCKENTKEIKSLIVEAEQQEVQVVVFPELSITGYTCSDLFAQSTLLHSAKEALREITEFTRGMDVIAIVGCPLALHSKLYDVAAIIYRGKIQGIVPKQTPSDDQRYFFPQTNTENSFVKLDYQDKDEIIFGNQLLFSLKGLAFAVEVGNSWTSLASESAKQILAGADVVFNPSACYDLIGNYAYRKMMLSATSARYLCGYVSASCGSGESTTDVVFGGHGFIYENGELLAEAERFDTKSQLIISDIDVESLRNKRMKSNDLKAAVSSTEIPKYEEVAIPAKEKSTSLTRPINPTPFIPQEQMLDERCNEVFNIQVSGLCKRIAHIHCKTAVIGISGGLDSTLALLVCAKAFDKLGRSRQDIVGITMPGFGTTGRTYQNALSLMKSLGISIREISIKEACIQHFNDIEHDINTHDVTYENSQARERTQILMDVANQLNGMVIGTGDLSELALGWATYNGDHMSMYGVNASVPKTLIQSLVLWIADHHVDGDSATTLRDIVDTPISPELIPADEQGNIKQKTEDLVGPYELHDFFLYYTVHHGFRPKKIFYLARQAFKGKYEGEVIKKWLTTFCRRFFNQQFKRSCLPDGPKVGSVSLSPRGDWHMPSDASSAEWLKECDEI